jgi:NodT family efflux transporter outer membrane factor (OMF) lipoprotein
LRTAALTFSCVSVEQVIATCAHDDLDQKNVLDSRSRSFFSDVACEMLNRKNIERATRTGFTTLVGVLSRLSVLFLLGGCAVGPDYKRPETAVNQNWRALAGRSTTPAAVNDLWWRAFNDAALNRLVELAYEQNLPLQIAGLRIAEARALLGVATGQQYPQFRFAGRAGAVGLSGNYGPAANVPIIDRRFVEYELGFDAAWELDIWGKYRRGVEAQAANLLASVGDYYYALVSLTAEVARTYATIRTFEVLVQQAEDNAMLQGESLRIADARFRNGATSELDVAQARTLFQSTRASIPPLRTGLGQARNALSTLIGQPVGAVDAVLTGPKQIPTPPAKVPVRVPAEMLRRRPDIRAAEFRAAAQCARIGVAKADLYPSFSLFGTIGFEASNSGGTYRNLFATDSLFYSVGPRVNWPFFSFGRLKNRVRVEDARFQQLLVAYLDTVLRAAQEVEDALTGFLNSRRALVFEEYSVKAAQRSNELALIQYQEGAVDYQRVLDAQRFLLEQENSLTETRSEIAVNLIALYKALGGGWELARGRPFIPERTQREMQERTDWGDMLSEPRAPRREQKAARVRR